MDTLDSKRGFLKIRAKKSPRHVVSIPARSSSRDIRSNELGGSFLIVKTFLGYEEVRLLILKEKFD